MIFPFAETKGMQWGRFLSRGKFMKILQKNTHHFVVELHDLSSCLGNGILVTSNSDIILLEGGRGHIDTSSSGISD
jgi:hypothetical protein